MCMLVEQKQKQTNPTPVKQTPPLTKSKKETAKSNNSIQSADSKQNIAVVSNDSIYKKAAKASKNKIDIVKEHAKRKQENQRLNLVVVGTFINNIYWC